MSDTTPAVVDHAVQDMNLWLKWLVERHHLRDRSEAYAALRATLHALRDRLTPEVAVHLGAQLPTLVRGTYFEGWRLAGKPTGEHTVDEFCGRVAAELPPGYPRDAPSLARAVFDLLAHKLDPGETAKVADHMPLPLRGLWPADVLR